MTPSILKLLPLTRNYDGYILTQVLRDKHKALYSVDDDIHFEVVQIGLRNARSIIARGGFTHEEVYPGTTLWGQSGWSYKGFQQALNKYNIL